MNDADIIEIQRRHANPEDECRCGSSQCQELVLSEELDTILTPKIIYRFSNQLDKLWPLLANKQMDVSSYLALLSEYRTEHHCGVAWPPSSVAFRCRTCSKAPTMSLCTDCFRDGNHEGHDYNMFKSRSGGACDCGYNVMSESGHCKRHGRNATAKRLREPIPENIICVPRRAMPRLVHRLAIQLRRSHVDLAGETDIYLDSLNQIAESSAVLRSLMIDAMISEEVYSSQIQLLTNHPDKFYATIVGEGLKKLKRERKGLSPFKIPEDWDPQAANINAFCDNKAPACFIDELIFWIVVFEFPQKLVCFVLGLLVDNRYRKVFAKAFVNQYPRIIKILAGLRDESKMLRQSRDSYEQMSRRILQISVQIYYDKELARILSDEEHILHTLLYCIRAAIEGIPSEGLRGVLKFNPLCLDSDDPPKVVRCGSPIIRDRHLGSITDDLNALLNFDREAKRLLSDKGLLKIWLKTVSYFQAMCPYKRELTEHTPYETGPHIPVFNIESDFCLAPLWSILNHLNKSSLSDDSILTLGEESSPTSLTESLLQSIHENLSIWFHQANLVPNSLLDPYHMSFHIPLHRMFAATLRNMLFTQRKSNEEVYAFIARNQSVFGCRYKYQSALGTPTNITINDFLRIILLHPLQVLTLYYEMRNSMWTRNGLMTINQAVTYVHCTYSHSTIDLDMFLLRYCASKLNPNYFLKALMSRFHAWKWLSFRSNSLMGNSTNETRNLYQFSILPEQIALMVESSLVLLIQLLTLSLHCNISEIEQTRQEMVALISVSDRSYSYLIDTLSPKGVSEWSCNDNDFISLLEELTDYKPAQHGIGGNLQQGCYTLKPNIWNDEYDPMQVQFRFYQKRDYQISLERFFQHSKLTGKLERRFHPSTLWPPLLIPSSIGAFDQFDLASLLECPALLGLVFSITYKSLYISDVPEAIIAYVIHILELALRRCMESREKKSSMNQNFTGRMHYTELTSCPAYFGSKGEAQINGNTLLSTLTRTRQTDEEVEGDISDKLFPVIEHALDLAFETTWFPFKSLLDNCLVHVENVYSLPSKKFEAMFGCVDDEHEERREVRAKHKRPPERPDDSWCMSKNDEDEMADNEEGSEGEEEEDDEDERDDDEDDYEEEIDGTDGDEETLEAAVSEAAAAADDGTRTNLMSSMDHDQANWSPVSESESELTGLVRRRFAGPGYEQVRTALGHGSRSSSSSLTLRGRGGSAGRRTHDRASSSRSYSWARGLRPAPETTQNLTLTTNTTTQSNSMTQGQEVRSVYYLSYLVEEERQQQPATYWTPDPVRRAEETVPTARVAASGSSANVESFIDDVEMTGSSQADSLGSGNTTAGQQPQLTGDHTYSASVDDDRMEVVTDEAYERAPGDGGSGEAALSLVPFQRPSAERPEPEEQHEEGEEEGQEQPQQIYPENLVTERRAILGPEPRPMIVGSARPLALDLAPSGHEQSLSELDIQARFTGFFQARSDSLRPSPRGFRQRQTARRGGFNPGPPFALHNPASSPNTLAAMARLGQRQRGIRSGVRASLAEQREPATASGSAAGPGQPMSAGRAGRSATATAAAASALLNRTLLLASSTESSGCGLSGLRRCKPLNLSLRRDRRMRHGESLLSLLLRLHAKYSQRASSYEYNELRAQANRQVGRGRIGDGVHFVTIVLDLICTSDQRMRGKLEQLRALIWTPKAGAEDERTQTAAGHTGKLSSDEGGGQLQPKEEASSSGRDEMEINIKTNSPAKSGTSEAALSAVGDLPATEQIGTSTTTTTVAADATITTTASPRLAGLAPAERRRRAREFQRRVMAEYASQQRAFMESYQSSLGGGSSGSAGGSRQSAHSGKTRSDKSFTGSPDEEPINLSSKLSPAPSVGQGAGGSQEPAAQIGDRDKQAQAQEPQPQHHHHHRQAQQHHHHNQQQQQQEQQSRPGIDDKRSTLSTSDNETGAGQWAHLASLECCICGGGGEPDADEADNLANPLGRVVLLQSTSVRGHAHLRPKSERMLPCDEWQHLQLKEETYAKYLERRIDLLCEHFSESSWLDSINIGAEGGVHVQSCGHYLHIKCHQSYIKSLDQEDRLRRADSDEFLCPVCRQLANSVLPILGDVLRGPNRGSRLALSALAAPGSSGADTKLAVQSRLISSMLKHRMAPNQRELQSSAAFCAHLTKATGPQYRLVRSSASMHSLFLFLTSIARTNLETEILVRSLTKRPGCALSGAACSSTANASTSSHVAMDRRHSCFQLLFHVLALNAQTLINDQWFTCDQVWSHLTHCIDERDRLSVKPANSEVPLLLRDPTTMLLQFLFAITGAHCSEANFSCLVQVLFNLTVIQSIALVLSYLDPSSLALLRRLSGALSYGAESASAASGPLLWNEFAALACQVADSLSPLLAPTTEEPLMNSCVRNSWPRLSGTLKAPTVEGSSGSGGSGCSSSSLEGVEPNEAKEAQDDDHVEDDKDEEENEREREDEKERGQPSVEEGTTLAMIESRVKLACLAYLRAAAFIKQALYDQAAYWLQLGPQPDERLAERQTIENEFDALVAYLGLAQVKAAPAEARKPARPMSIVDALEWPPGSSSGLDGLGETASNTTAPLDSKQGNASQRLISSWSAELLRFNSDFSIAARSLLICRPLTWHRPALMQLPRSFEDIFMFYYRKKCTLCQQVPKDVAVCLVCGAPICFRVSCCKDRSRSRQVHSQHCGANTAVYLAVHTSSIVVIRGSRACVWGSVYLDAHDEEDNGLQRGRPLYLVPARYALLEEQWLTHSFDHTCGKRWIHLQEAQQ